MKKYSAIVMLGLALMVTACQNGSEQKTAAVQEETTASVQVAKVFVQDVPQIYEFTATVQAFVKNNIAPMMAVRINKLFVEVGDYVKKGQKLVQMDNNNLEQAKTQLDNLELSFSRIDELYKIGGVSKSDWDAQHTALTIARTSYQNLVENTQLLSPINGIITARNYDNGDLYAMAKPIYVVEQISPVKVMINASEQLFTKVKKGNTVTLNLDVFPGESFQGKVSLVYPTINEVTRTFPVEITIANNNSRVRPGMFARVTMNLGTEQRVVVPDRAVIKQQGSGDRYVFVHSNGIVNYRKVNLGQRFDNTYEVISGLEDGAEVVIAGQTRLNDGSSVSISNK